MSRMAKAPIESSTSTIATPNRATDARVSTAPASTSGGDRDRRRDDESRRSCREPAQARHARGEPRFREPALLVPAPHASAGEHAPDREEECDRSEGAPRQIATHRVELQRRGQDVRELPPEELHLLGEELPLDTGVARDLDVADRVDEAAERANDKERDGPRAVRADGDAEQRHCLAAGSW